MSERPMGEAPKDELARIESEIKALEERRREIYRASLTAPEEHKVGPDFLAEMLGEEPWPEMAFPIDVHGITWSDVGVLVAGRRGATWVAVRPCGEGEKRTHLGFLLGDLATSASARYDRASGVLAVSLGMHNPAMWVPDLGRVVFGYESWWGPLKGPEDLRQITDADIQDVWYVRALRDLEKGAGK